MLNKKNAAYAVFGFALVGCNKVLAGCNCCKSVPKELEKFTLIFKNLKGVTYANLNEFFKTDNCKEEFSGKDLIDKGLAVNGQTVASDKSKFFIVNSDDKKNEIKVYEGTTEGESKMKNECSGKKYKTIEIKFKSKDNKASQIKKDEDNKFVVETIEIGATEETVPGA